MSSTKENKRIYLPKRSLRTCKLCKQITNNPKSLNDYVYISNLRTYRNINYLLQYLRVYVKEEQIKLCEKCIDQLINAYLFKKKCDKIFANDTIIKIMKQTNKRIKTAEKSNLNSKEAIFELNSKKSKHVATNLCNDNSYLTSESTNNKITQPISLTDFNNPTFHKKLEPFVKVLDLLESSSVCDFSNILKENHDTNSLPQNDSEATSKSIETCSKILISETENQKIVPNIFDTNHKSIKKNFDLNLNNYDFIFDNKGPIENFMPKNPKSDLFIDNKSLNFSIDKDEEKNSSVTPTDCVLKLDKNDNLNIALDFVESLDENSNHLNDVFIPETKMLEEYLFFDTIVPDLFQDIHVENLYVEPKPVETNLSKTSTNVVFHNLYEYYTSLSSQKENITTPKINCFICKKLFETKKKLYIHMKVHRKSQFLCNNCTTHFCNKFLLKAHKCSDNSDILCLSCNETFKNCDILSHSCVNSHMREGNQKALKSCNNLDVKESYVCGNEVNSEKSSVRIMSKKAYKCHLCRRKFWRRNELENHISNGHKARDFRYLCHICSHSFMLQNNFVKHMENAHGILNIKAELLRKA